MKIHKGDLVRVEYGAHKGKTGRVEKVGINNGRAVVAGVGLVKKHLRQSSGGLMEKTSPIDISKLVIICPKCQKATRLGYREENDKKIRFCKKCQAAIS